MSRLFPVLAVVLLLPLWLGTSRADLSQGLIAHYTFNNNLMDSSGHGNHGTAVGGFTYTLDRFVTMNSAGRFNGLDSYILIPSSQSLSSPDTACTQAAWVYLEGTSMIGSAFGPLIMKSTTTENAFMYRMTVQPAGIGTSFNNWGTSQDLPIALSLHQWYHVAAVLGGGSVRFYLDGALVGSAAAAVTIVTDTRDLTIGADFPGNLEIFNGNVDDLRIYSRALSAAEIAELAGVSTGVAPTLLPLPMGPGYPNPFSREARVDFTLENSSPVRLLVYDAAGRQIRERVPGVLPAGPQTVVWDGRDDLGRSMPAGIYFMRLQAGSQDGSRRVVRVP